MATYITRPQEVQAIQWKGNNFQEVEAFVKEWLPIDHKVYLPRIHEWDLFIESMEYPIRRICRGEYIAVQPGIWYNNYHPDTFAEKFIPKEEATPTPQIKPLEWKSKTLTGNIDIHIAVVGTEDPQDFSFLYEIVRMNPSGMYRTFVVLLDGYGDRFECKVGDPTNTLEEAKSVAQTHYEPFVRSLLL